MRQDHRAESLFRRKALQAISAAVGYKKGNYARLIADPWKRSALPKVRTALRGLNTRSPPRYHATSAHPGSKGSRRPRRDRRRNREPAYSLLLGVVYLAETRSTSGEAGARSVAQARGQIYRGPPISVTRLVIPPAGSA